MVLGSKRERNRAQKRGHRREDKRREDERREDKGQIRSDKRNITRAINPLKRMIQRGDAPIGKGRR